MLSIAFFLCAEIMEDKIKILKNYERLQEIQKQLVWPSAVELDSKSFIPEVNPILLIMPPFEEGGAYCFAHVRRSVGRSVGMSVSFNLVKLITQERFATGASDLIGR